MSEKSLEDTVKCFRTVNIRIDALEFGNRDTVGLSDSVTGVAITAKMKALVDRRRRLGPCAYTAVTLSARESD